jgi:hypothetical protein
MSPKNQPSSDKTKFNFRFNTLIAAIIGAAILLGIVIGVTSSPQRGDIIVFNPTKTLIAE